MILATTLLLIAAEVLIGVALAFLPIGRIRDWFAKVSLRFTEDVDHWRITLHEKLKTGKHRFVYGVFNRRTSTFVDGESVISDKIDPELEALHNGAPLVIHA